VYHAADSVESRPTKRASQQLIPGETRPMRGRVHDAVFKELDALREVDELKRRLEDERAKNASTIQALEKKCLEKHEYEANLTARRIVYTKSVEARLNALETEKKQNAATVKLLQTSLLETVKGVAADLMEQREFTNQLVRRIEVLEVDKKAYVELQKMIMTVPSRETFRRLKAHMVKHRASIEAASRVFETTRIPIATLAPVTAVTSTATVVAPVVPTATVPTGYEYPTDWLDSSLPIGTISSIDTTSEWTSIPLSPASLAMSDLSSSSASLL